MTPIDLTTPLRSLRALCGLSHRTLGERLTSPLSDVAVVKAEAKGPRIKLATLAAYARAAGWRLRVGVEARRHGVLMWGAQREADDLDVTVAGARALLAALRLEMSLAVEAAEQPAIRSMMTSLMTAGKSRAT